MNFILYEDAKKYIDVYKKTILKLMGSNNLNYNVLVISKYDKNLKKIVSELKGNKIYLLDIEVPGKGGIELAREIRKNGDWTSPIIIVSSHDEFKSVGYTRKILMLDFISKNKSIEGNLYETLSLAQKILLTKKSFCFKERGELFQIPLEDIYYVEKCSNDNLALIITKNNTYKIRSTIQKLERELNEANDFFRTHRSYLVNIKNIRHIDFDMGEIKFSNNKLALVSRTNKKKLKNKVNYLQIN